MRIKQDGTNKVLGRLLKSASQSYAGRQRWVGRHEKMLHYIAVALATMMVASFSGPWSDQEASRALQRDMSNMATGPERQPLQDSNLRTPLTRRATVLLFWFSFSLLFSWVGVGGRITFSLRLYFDTKQNYTMSAVYRKGYNTIMHMYGGKELAVFSELGR